MFHILKVSGAPTKFIQMERFQKELKKFRVNREWNENKNGLLSIQDDRSPRFISEFNVGCSEAFIGRP